jgi:hypothetical protein
MRVIKITFALPCPDYGQDKQDLPTGFDEKRGTGADGQNGQARLDSGLLLPRSGLWSLGLSIASRILDSAAETAGLGIHVLGLN